MDSAAMTIVPSQFMNLYRHTSMSLTAQPLEPNLWQLKRRHATFLHLTGHTFTSSFEVFTDGRPAEIQYPHTHNDSTGKHSSHTHKKQTPCGPTKGDCGWKVRQKCDRKDGHIRYGMFKACRDNCIKAEPDDGDLCHVAAFACRGPDCETHQPIT